MDRERKNQHRRERYAALSDTQKAELLKRRRERYHEKKARVSVSMDDVPVAQFSSSSANTSVGIDVMGVCAYGASRVKSAGVCLPSSSVISASGASRVKSAGICLPSSSVVSAAKRNRPSRLIEAVPLEQWSLPPISTCIYCGALRFYRESPTFCCGEGQVSLAPRVMVPELAELLTGDSEISVEFRKHIRSYNNDTSFTTIGMRTDSRLCSSRGGAYSVVVQGAVFHNLNSINENSSSGANLDLYFHEVGDGGLRSGGRSSYLRADLVSHLSMDNSPTKTSITVSWKFKSSKNRKMQCFLTRGWTSFTKNHNIQQGQHLRFTITSVNEGVVAMIATKLLTF